MHLSATYSLTELRALLVQLLPIRIHLEMGERQRWIELRDPTSVSLVAGRGLRVVCAGAVRYDVGPLHSRVLVREVSLLLIPSVRALTEGEASALGFQLEIERADIAMVPEGIDSLVIAGVNELLASKAEQAMWSDRAMVSKLPMPAQLVPLEAFHLGAHWTAVTVEHDRVVLEMSLSARITRAEAGLPSDEAQEAAGDAEGVLS